MGRRFEVVSKGYITKKRMERIADSVTLADDEMLVRCEREGTVFIATPYAYPFAEDPTKSSTNFCKTGDREITCPTCGRGYFIQDDGTWFSDRKLTVIREGGKR